MEFGLVTPVVPAAVYLRLFVTVGRSVFMLMTVCPSTLVFELSTESVVLPCLSLGLIELASLNIGLEPVRLALLSALLY